MTGVAQPSEEIGDRVSKHSGKVKWEMEDVRGEILPRRFGNAGDEAVAGELTEADAAHVESSHVASIPAAQPAAIINPRRMIRFFACCERGE